MENKIRKEEEEKEVVRIVSNAYYSMQSVRISMNNSIRNLIRRDVEGMDMFKTEQKKEIKANMKKYTDKQMLEYLDFIHLEMKLPKEKYKFLKKCFQVTIESERLEKQYYGVMKTLVEDEPVYTEYLKHIKGISFGSVTNMLCRVGYCENFTNVAKLWAYAGYSVTAGIGQKRKRGEKLNFNTQLKTDLYKMADCLIKANKGYFRQIYDTEKEKHVNREYEVGELKDKYPFYKKEDTHIKLLHAHNRAIRKMMKHFLSMYFQFCKEHLGEKTLQDMKQEMYQVKILGHDVNDIKTWKDIIKMEN